MANENNPNVVPDQSSIQSNQDTPELDTGLDALTTEAPAAPATTEARTSADAAKPGQAPRDLTQLKVEKGCSRGLAGWLGQHCLSLAITSYQTGRIYLGGSDQQGRVSFFERIFERAMGVVGNAQRI